MTDLSTQMRDRARKLRAGMTPQERRLWLKLREVNRMIAANFRRQAPVGRYIADFADFGRKLVIEVDGGHHGGPEDAARDDWFRAQGFTVLRFWNSEVDGNIEGVMQVVLDAMTGAVVPTPPPPTPPHEGEGRRVTGDAGSADQSATQPPPPRGEGWGGGATP